MGTKPIEEPIGKKLKPKSGKRLRERWAEMNLRQSANVEYADNPTMDDYAHGAKPLNPPPGVPKSTANGGVIPVPSPNPRRQEQVALNSQVTPGEWKNGKNRK